jgi:circadian clock protein KaiB
MNAGASNPLRFDFRLFVAGDATNSAQALANLRAMCQEHAADRYAIEVVDVFVDPERALAGSVFMTPTLIKLAPPPIRRVVGTLADTQKMLEVLGLVSTRV